ncbi:I78 family peptidase inhibitor [Coralloluteibacterium thermophilus]|uniref:I78 family peptidase inhibitor n=1 Tax=Coralloluteibacterium thermophilum TaxID=2707049 RepID=A0ABV9NLS0_9GAMM
MTARPILVSAAALAAFALAACSPEPPAPEQRASTDAGNVATAPAGGTAGTPAADAPGLTQDCDADGARDLVGQAWNDGMQERARTAANARTVRVVRPDDAVTMDFRGDRLNVLLDADDRVTEVACN